MEEQKDNKKTCFYELTEQKIKEITELLNFFGDVNKKDKKGGVPLAYAVCGSDLALVQELLKHDADVNFVCSNGLSILDLAVIFSTPEIVQLLIYHAAETDTADSKKITPLMHACERGNIEIVMTLLPQSNINAVGLSQETALIFAIKNDHIEIAKLLLDAGAYVNVPEIDSPLDLVHRKGSKAMKRLFIAYDKMELFHYYSYHWCTII